MPTALSCEAKLTNGPQALKAMAMEWDAYDVKGTQIFHSTTVSDFVFPLPGEGTPVAPGAGFSITGHPPPHAAKVVCRTIFEEFANGTIWGDKHSSALVQLRATRTGAQEIIQFLKQAKGSVGAEKALEELGVN